MSKISKSPQRNTFQKEKYLERQSKKGKTPENDVDTKAAADFYESWDSEKEKRESDPEWQKNNMEYDLRSTDWILEKVRNCDIYSQNLYAAMCNNDFVKRELWPILRMDPDKDLWHCSWRYAGGIIADMRQEGDYIDWYCSGIRGGMDLSEEAEESRKDKNFVPEGMITKEVEEDLSRLGWIPAPGGDWENFN